jgi:uncharacterized protein (TIGR03437 family)
MELFLAAGIEECETEPTPEFCRSRLFRNMRTQFLLGTVSVAVMAIPGLRAQSGPPPEVYSANSSADYSTTIAQGSLFVVFGYNLGPASLVQVSAFPLPNVLAGTSVTVKSGSATLNCPMIYTSNAQVAAILPSNTPVGTAVIAVALNGVNGYSSTEVTVAASSEGIFTTTSSGLGAGIFTALDGSLKTFSNSAKPGEIVTAWGTGIGPIGTPDNVLPTSFPNFPNVQVWVGGQAAQVAYAGRSGCCAAVDQISFTVPAVGSGCNVPVLVVSGGNSSNAVTMPVMAGGGACSDAGPTLPTSLLTKAASGQPVKVGIIAAGPTALVGSSPSADAVAASLSAALHTRVPVADAARLIRAYRSRNPKAIRLAMAKYAAQWKALDARTKAGLIAKISLTQESISADFGSLSSEATVATVASAQFPAVGECMVLTGGYPNGLGSVGAGLDAGSSLMLTGAAGSHTLQQTSKGEYQASFGASVTGPDIPLGTYTISGTGGKDVGAFSATVTIASHLAIANKSALATVYTTQPLTVNWTGGVAGQYMLIGGGTTHGPHTYFTCAADGGTGTFTVPSYILSSINTAAESNGVLWISPNPLSNPITIPGLDAAYFADASSDSVNVAFGVMTGVQGANTANISGSIDGLYPASGATAALNGGNSTDGPVSFSALLTAGTFTAAFDILPGASPFVVQATSAAGSATININPAQNTWQASYVVPTALTRNWNFSAAGFTVTDFSGGGQPFPGNVIPFSRVDPLAEQALNGLPLPNVAGPAGANGTWSASGTLPAGGHFTIGANSNPPQNFGGFINLTTRGAQSTSFSLYVDGQLVASKQVPFTTD